jgi:hypothetical protein
MVSLYPSVATAADEAITDGELIKQDYKCSFPGWVAGSDGRMQRNEELTLFIIHGLRSCCIAGSTDPLARAKKRSCGLLSVLQALKTAVPSSITRAGDDAVRL